MTPTEWLNLLKTRNAKNRLAGGAVIQAQQAALASEISQRLTVAGGNPALWDYPNGASLGSALTGNTNSTVLVLPQDFVKNPVLIRITTTIGATPTATFTVQGSHDNSTWFPIDYADSATPDTFGQSAFVITQAITVMKVLRPGPKMRYVRVNISANTNVTVTSIDATYL